jgi:hypothetical protein
MLLIEGTACVVIVIGFLFTSYLTPEIIQSQSGGPSVLATDTFQSLHQALVTDFNFLMVALAIMMAKVSFQKDYGFHKQNVGSQSC